MTCCLQACFSKICDSNVYHDTESLLHFLHDKKGHLDRVEAGRLVLRGYSVRSINTFANAESCFLYLMLNYSAKVAELQRQLTVLSRSSSDSLSSARMQTLKVPCNTIQVRKQFTPKPSQALEIRGSPFSFGSGIQSNGLVLSKPTQVLEIQVVSAAFFLYSAVVDDLFSISLSSPSQCTLATSPLLQG